jgi:hypothetical protein
MSHSMKIALGFVKTTHPRIWPLYGVSRSIGCDKTDRNPSASDLKSDG